MRYWVLKNKEGKITRSDFTEFEGSSLEIDIHKYTINDCYLQGTIFQLKVWKAISEIPIGEIKTYGELVKVCGGAPIAIGTACKNNKIPVVIPCHRVVGKAKPLAFNGGSEVKKQLLIEEGIFL